MAGDPVSRVLIGELNDLPPLSSQVVRIFISSTFTDTREERNHLMAEVYPKLKKYCREKFNLEFQVVDMRWGVRDHALDDHAATSICLQEISTCQKVSTGPSFVTFLGQRHGSRPLPSTIAGAEFTALLSTLKAAGRDTELVEQWFIQDENACPPVYVLQPVSSKIPDFLSEDQEKKQIAQNKWNSILQEITDTVRYAARNCLEIDDEAKKKYFMSVTEIEVQEGLVQASQPDSQCLCFLRTIEDLPLDHPLAWRFIDVQARGGGIDDEAQRMLEDLKSAQIMKTLRGDNIKSDRVKWSGHGGISPQDHSDYLSTLGDQFFASVTQLISAAMSSHSEWRDNEVYSECLQHLHLARDRCSIFRGREDILINTKDKLLRSEGRPVTLYGHSGCGKTSMMAKTVQLVKEWIPNGRSCNIICRFLGTSPKSSSIHQALTNICQQIKTIYSIDTDKKVPSDFNDVSLLFAELLNTIPVAKPLVLILDSLDQLSPQNYAHKLGWLPSNVPSHVHIVLSTLPTMYGIMNTLHGKFGEDSMLRVPNLEDSLCLDILTMWLSNEKRTLTSDQLNIVSQAFKACSLPLYVRLLTEEVNYWHSYDPASINVLKHSIKEVLQGLFGRLEAKHGNVIVHHALAYVSASKQGLGETELEDMLSLDDVVLTDVFQYHVPPIRRIPPLLWVRIRHDISSYLVTREADSIQVIFWYHRQFIETARERFLGNVEFSKTIHHNMAEYYEGKWHQVKKPFKYTHAQATKLKLQTADADADRKVMEQPLTYADGAYNTRKLNCLPYHLANAHEEQKLKEQCLFNYLWTLTKLKACGIHSILRDISFISADVECDLLSSAMNLIKSTIHLHPDSLSVEISGRLISYANESYPHIEKLVKQSCQLGLKSNVLFPKGQMYEGPGGPLKYTLEDIHMTVQEKLLCLGPGSQNLFAMNDINELIMWDLSTGEVEKQQTLLKDKSQTLNVLRVVTMHDTVHNFQNFSNDADAGKKEKMLMLVACAFQTSYNPVVVIDASSGNIVHSVNLEKIFTKIGFIDNLAIDLVGDELIWHIKGKGIDVFDIQTGKLLKSLEGAATFAEVLSSRKELLVYTKEPNQLDVYSISSWKVRTSIQLTAPLDIMIPYHNSSDCLLVDKKSHQVAIHDTEFGLKAIGTFNYANHDSSDLKNAVLSKDDTLLILCFSDKFVIWNLQKNKHEKTFAIPETLKSKYKVQSTYGELIENKTMLVCAYEQYLVFWSMKTGKLIRTLPAACAKVICTPLVSEDNSLIITTANKSAIIKVWDTAQSHTDLKEPITLSAPVRYLVSAVDTPRVVVRTYRASESCVVNASTCQILSYQSKDIDVMYPNITGDGRYTILRQSDSEKCINLWDAESGALASVIPLSSLNLMICCASYASEFVATECESSPTENVRLQLWHLRTGKHIRDFAAVEGGISYMFFANHDTQLVTLQQYPETGEFGEHCTLHVYNVHDGQEVFKLINILKNTLQVVPPDDSSILVVQSGDPYKTLIIDCKDNFAIKKSFNFVPRRRISISADGLRCLDPALQVFDLETGERLCQFTQTHESLIGRNPYAQPKITFDGKHAVWLVRTEVTLLVGCVASGNIVGKCFIHSTPLSLVVTCDNSIGVGTDEGHIMLLDLINLDQRKAEDVFSESRDLVNRVALKKNGKTKAKTNAKSKSCNLL